MGLSRVKTKVSQLPTARVYVTIREVENPGLLKSTHTGDH